ncbi:hypothetical protein CR162_09220 [Pseudoroseomonas rhizosphaerae]|uniref:Uncharacterized protein n=1 Tax=Teichococcus rhizosphaerae TaxID=1335062 RepID=A0A2C7AF86_9PROT|nr:hypothetical protein [Pseudoroseomonas rhizosphaerae]PHK95337.1 hypothetical protein CR162_09220 [Pseudoroseomonas rhizosphaerae]
MNLTPEQAAAAMARGCRFVAADEQQVGLLSMQRRVFWIEGKPCLALRNDGFYETAATLGRLLEQPGPDPAAEAPLAAAAPEPVATPADMPAAEQPPSGPETAATPPAPAATAPEAAPISEGQASAPSGDEPGEAPAPAPVRKAAPASLVLTANMVSRYVSAATVDSKDLPELIRSIHRSVCALHTRTDGG